MYQLASELILAITGSIITLIIQQIIRYYNKPVIKASIVSGNDSNGVSRVLRVNNKGKTVMEGLFVEVIIGYEDYMYSKITKMGSINPGSFTDIHIGI